MVHFASSNLWCLGNQNCLQLALKVMSNNVTETASVTLGVTSVIAWFVAEIPQLITNYRGKSTKGLSVAFLVTWLIGDVFNIVGCLLEPATLPTQLYTALLYGFITLTLCLQAFYYGLVYPRLKLSRQLKNSEHWQAEAPPNAERNKGGIEKANDGDQSNRSARYLSKSHSPKAGFIFHQSMATTSHSLNPEEEPLLGSAIAAQSSPVLNNKTTLCLASTLTFLGAFNLLQSPNRKIHSMVPKPRQEFVIYVGRKLLMVSGNLSPEHGEEGNNVIVSFLGWTMVFIYIGGRLPQIFLNFRRGHCKGVNPFMFIFALVGNGTYIASILVRSLDWSINRPNLPWLVESGGCFLLDFFILMQFLYFGYYSTSEDRESKYKYQNLA